MIKKCTYIFLVIFITSFTNVVNAQQVLDSLNWITVDNLNDNNTGTGSGTVLCDTTYCEVKPISNVPAGSDGWWSNTGSVWFGNNSRRTSRLGGNPINGASATFIANIPVTDYYLVYCFMANSANASRDVKVSLKRFGEGVPADSFRWNSQDNTVLSQGYGSWLPLGVINVPMARQGLEVKLEADTLTPNILRVDGVRILRSSQTGADIEFGRRPIDGQVWLPIVPPDTIRQLFKSHRLVEEFPQTTFKWGIYTDKKIKIFNIGSQDLVVTNVKFSTTRFKCVTPFPLNVAPGATSFLTIRFSPKGEEATKDTMVVQSNDALEPDAVMPIVGEGINYNFIMNASDGSEPHWNAPLPTSYVETGAAAWLSSIASPFAFPIPNGNSRSRVYTAADIPTCTYGFQVPDSITGKYLLEYSGPQGSANAAQNVTVQVVTPFVADTQVVRGFNSRIPTTTMWGKIQDNTTRVFQLNGGDLTLVRYTNPNQPTDLLRSDLLRVRLLPLAPTVSTSADTRNNIISYGSVSVYDSIRLAEFNYQQTLQIRSNGETPLQVDSIRITGRDRFFYKLENIPTLPLTLPAVDGLFNLVVSINPSDTKVFFDTTWNATRDTIVKIDTINGGIRLYTAYLRFKTNDPNKQYLTITLSGQGKGTSIIVDDEDPTTFKNTDVVTWNSGAPTELNKWQKIAGSGQNGSRIFTYIYGYQFQGVTPDSNYIEWFPKLDKRPDGPATEPDSFDVYVQLPTGSSTGNPKAVYEVHSPFSGITRLFKNQNSSTYGGDVTSTGRIFLGRYIFLRGGQDIHGSGTIFGHVKMINNFADVTEFYKDSIVNRALIDSFVTRADAVILEQASRVVGVTEATYTPLTFNLSQNYPNPFNPNTFIKFSIPIAEKVSLKIYDILGREVRTLIDSDFKAGNYTFEWDGRNNFGSLVSSGIYIYRINAGKYIKSLKMLMVK